MEEKVRHYSSGMVSRLAFAIASAGQVSGVLILDEVLSVGDRFFREKSEKRIRELIGGGTAGLIVSHLQQGDLDREGRAAHGWRAGCGLSGL